MANVWIVAETYYPEETSTGFFMTGLAEGLADQFRVSAICSQPTYAARGVRAPWREVRHGVQIFRARGTTFDKNVLPLRLVNLATITLALTVTLLRRLRRGDVMLVVTNPPSLPYLARCAAWVRGARCVLWIHDMYPEALVAAGVLSRQSLITRLMQSAAAALYRSSDAVCVCGRDLADVVRPKAGRVPVHVMTNWASDDVLDAAAVAPNPFRTEQQLDGKFIVEYAGNLGKVQDVACIVAAADRVGRVAPDVQFVFIGGGQKRLWLAEEVRRRGLTNISMVAERPRSDQAAFLTAADVCIMAFVPGMCGVSVPSRLYNMMAAGRPIIAAMDRESEPALVIAEHRIGWVVAPGDDAALANAVLSARADGAGLREMGERARTIALRDYRSTRITDRFAAVVAGLAPRAVRGAE